MVFADMPDDTAAHLHGHAVDRASGGQDARHEQDQQKPDQIPQALIEKRGMDLDILRGAGPQAHPPGQRGLGAEGLPIDEVGPAADALAQQQAHHRQVRHGAHLDLLVPGVEKCHDGPGNHRAVDG